MTLIALFLVSVVPALGGIAIWVAWKYAKAHIEHRDELRRREIEHRDELRRRELEQYRSGINPVLSEEIERLR